MEFQINIEKNTRKELEKILKQAEKVGDLRGAKRIMSVFALATGQLVFTVTSIFNVCERTVQNWVEAFLLNGPEGLKSKKSPGRKPKLTKSQKRELGKMIDKGPESAGFPGACWRTPMIQALILEKFGVFHSVHYISQLLRNMGFSYQKARFVSDHKDPKKRKEWLQNQWPEILTLVEQKKALILFGDEVSFPQWGSLSYTWGRRGKQPLSKTSGTRKSYKVFGLIEYFSGRFFCKGYEGRLNSETYKNFLKEILEETREHLILIQDGASYHTSKATKQFFEEKADRLTVYQLPSYSPDYNPIEKLWKKVKEKEIHLHYFPTFESLKKKVEQALLHFKGLKNEVEPLFGFYRKLTEKIAKKIFAHVTP